MTEEATSKKQRALAATLGNAVVYLIPTLAVLFFGADLKLFFAVIFLEILGYTGGCIYRIKRFSNDVGQIVMGTMYMLPGILITTLFLVITLMNKTDAEGAAWWISQVALLAAMAMVIHDRIRIFKTQTLRELRFQQKINDCYMVENEPEQPVIKKSEILKQSVVYSYAFIFYNAIILGGMLFISMVIMALTNASGNITGPVTIITVFGFKLITDFMKYLFRMDEWSTEEEERSAQWQVKRMRREGKAVIQRPGVTWPRS